MVPEIIDVRGIAERLGGLAEVSDEVTLSGYRLRFGSRFASSSSLLTLDSIP